MLALILSSLLTLYIVNTIKNLLHHRNRAIQTGLPYILLPVSEHNVAYLLLFETRFLAQLIRLLPPWLADYFYISSFKSRWCAKERFHEKFGPVYFIASPGSLTCAVADAGAISQIFMDRRGFPKPVEQYEPVAIFGPNVVTCSDQNWPHHHRYTSTTFNEKNNALVWSETIRQVNQMTEYWVDEYSTSPTEFLLSSPRDDILKFTLNIICSAGFGVKLPFRPAPEATTEDALALFKDALSPPQGFHFTFRGVMEYLHHNIMSVFVANGLPKWIPRGCFPFFKRTFEADDDLRKYLRALLEETRQSGSKNYNLLEGMVQSQTAESESSRDKGLSDDEVLGNMYMFMLAGHETTANTLRFTLVLLALHQDVQEWVYQGVMDAIHDQSDDPFDWEYTHVYPKLITPLCVMLETLRLYPSVVSPPKCTSSSPASITINNQTHHIPPHTSVNLNCGGLHYSKEYWGEDVHTFNPSRWDKRNRSSFLARNEGITGLVGPGLESNSIHRPVRGAYLPFSDGFRGCMGKKFAQVEFVVAVAVLLREYKIDLAGGDIVEAKRQAQKVLDGSATVLTLSMREEVPLVFRRRS